MKKEFYDLAWEQIEYWQNQDKKTLKKISLKHLPCTPKEINSCVKEALIPTSNSMMETDQNMVLKSQI